MPPTRLRTELHRWSRKGGDVCRTQRAAVGQACSWLVHSQREVREPLLCVVRLQLVASLGPAEEAIAALEQAAEEYAPMPILISPKVPPAYEEISSLPRFQAPWRRLNLVEQGGSPPLPSPLPDPAGGVHG